MGNKELHNFYTSPNIITLYQTKKQSRRYGQIGNSIKILVGRSERTKQLGWSVRRRKGNIKMYLKKYAISYKGVDWIHVAEDKGQWRALMNTVMNLRAPWKGGHFLTSWATVSFSRKTPPHGVNSTWCWLYITKYSVAFYIGTVAA
jgi:hypothetical protein